MATLSRDLRRELERTVIKARRTAEDGARKTIESLAVHNDKPWPTLSDEQKRLRVRLRAHGRQLGDREATKRDTQTIGHLIQECAYEHWHRMLFARFLAENDLLIEPESGVAISLDECREFAMGQGKDWLALASDFGVRMLPQIFRQGDPVLEVTLPPETRQELEGLLKALSGEVFAADDSLGWVYQFWQTEQKEQVNKSGVKIGADELAAVTQLFTEDYMVLFLLHNTLGAWWAGKVLAAKPESATQARDEDELRAACSVGGYEWTYLRFIREGETGPWRPAAGTFDGWPRAARELKVLDPCMGSGHFLVFALPILVAFRMEEGLSKEQAVDAVLRDNLFGLELDNRCTQIAAFNLALTAWRMAGYRPLPPLNLACSGLGINAKEEDWLKLAGNNFAVHEWMRRFYALFRDAPALGSLIDPARFMAREEEVGFDRALPLLEGALKKENATDEAQEMAVAARGLLAAFRILTSRFTLLATNVPYLKRGKQREALQQFSEAFHEDSKGNLACCMADRCLRFCAAGGTTALVVINELLFLGTYRRLRRRLLTESQWDAIARLGAAAFETISGEVVNVSLLIVSRLTPEHNSEIGCLDARSQSTPAGKAAALRVMDVVEVSQHAQLANPDARIVLTEVDQAPLLGTLAAYGKGSTTGDSPHYHRCFWEVSAISEEAVPWLDSPQDGSLWSGRSTISIVALDDTRLLEENGCRIHGQEVWGKTGVAVNKMSGLQSFLYAGEVFDDNVGIIAPRDEKLTPAILAYCGSGEYQRDIRAVDQAIKVTAGTLVKVPFEVSRWQTIAAELYANGLPRPYSQDATQWLFNGDPKGSDHPLQVAMARLIGYRWPRQTGSSFMDCPALGPDGLEKHADSDGIVALNAVKGEAAAADRLRVLLAGAYSTEWSAQKLKDLLGENESLEAWLRDRFFEEHCRIFHQRPFIWQIWDGLRDSFHALVNYHKLAAPNGAGRQTLEKLIYSYLGDWIDRQRADQRNGVEGADARVAAAQHLQSELKKILEGDPPYDIFVRWKPLHEQPIGWEPDINDGVRINIRPFMAAKVLNGRGKSACILRFTPKIKWEKDRGKEPHRSKEDFPWFWSCDGTALDFTGARDFDGNRWNDLHYARKHKQEARNRSRQEAR